MKTASLPAASAAGTMAPTRGMTLRAAAVARFFDLLDAYREARGHLRSPEGMGAFVALSVQLHAAKGAVPKRYWPLVNQAFKEAA